MILIRRTMGVLGAALALALATRADVPAAGGPAGVQDGSAAAQAAAADADEREPDVGMRFEGYLPGSIDPELEGTFAVEFRIYRSPQGGEPIWRESHEVRVERGRMDVMLGTRNRIPMHVHEATFKFLGASVDGGREVYPRYAIVNVVYVSPKEALVARTERDEAEADAAYRRQRAARVAVADATEAPCTWREALVAARRAGGDLPGYEDWYRSLRTAPEEAVLERAGHYEWVLPWVYDTASHGSYNRYFRGRFQGCDYMDLSPEKRYAYRIARPLPEREAPESPKTGDRDR